MGFPDYTILLVEDNSDDVRFVQRAFEIGKIANKLDVISYGEEALAFLKGDGKYADRESYAIPVLVLLDLNLPDISGFDVLKWIRSNPAYRELPVIVLTSSKSSKDIAEGQRLGATTYLVKPVKTDALVEAVKSLQMYWPTGGEKAVIM
jgi:CheY-like chemotaxis protein